MASIIRAHDGQFSGDLRGPRASSGGCTFASSMACMRLDLSVGYIENHLPHRGCVVLQTSHTHQLCPPVLVQVQVDFLE